MFRARVSVRLPLLVVAALAAPLAGCPSDDVVGDIDASVSCLAATRHDDLPWIQDNVLTPSCSNFTSCHKGTASMAGDLSLETGRSHAEMVGVASKQFPAWTLVVPGDPMHSYLMVALGQYPGPLDPRVGTMPFNSRLLCKQKRDAIERWILAGAPETSPVDAGVDGP